MKHIAKSLLIISALAAAGSATADCCWWEDLCMSPFIGVDYKETWMKGSGDWNNVVSRSYPGGTVYVGSRFSDCWGLELGYSATSNKSKNTQISGDFFGRSNVNASLNSKVRFQSYHLDINGYLPMDDCCEWELIGSIGIAGMKPKVSGQVVSGNLTNAQINAFNTIHGKTRGIARIGVGTNYYFCDMIGARAMLRWENTRNLRIEGTNTSSTLVTGKPFKDAVSLAVGLFLQW